MPTDPRQQIRVIAARIADQVMRSAGKGTKAAAIFFAARLKEVVSVPAPRKRSVSRLGDISYRAKVRAIHGAPPRKLSGKLRQSITYAIHQPGGGVQGSGNKPRKLFGKLQPTAVVGVKARSPRGFNYPKALESDHHKFVVPTLRRYRKDLVRIIGKNFRLRSV